MTALGALLKSIMMCDLYSFRANSDTIVDLPTRRAPSMSKALFPALSSYHCSILLYIFRLNCINVLFLIKYDYKINKKCQNTKI